VGVLFLSPGLSGLGFCTSRLSVSSCLINDRAHVAFFLKNSCTGMEDVNMLEEQTVEAGLDEVSIIIQLCAIIVKCYMFLILDWMSSLLENRSKSC
jgi:hypothetical protein